MDGVNLQTIVDGHLQRLLSLRDHVVRCHAALCGSSELHWEQYLRALPPQPRGGSVPTHSKIHRGAEGWLLANGIRDVVMLNAIYFEQIRQLLEFNRIAGQSGTEEEKTEEVRRCIEAKPATYAEAIQQLDRLLDDGFPRRSEFESLEMLFTVFAAQTAGEPYPGGDVPIVVTLCTPEPKGAPDPNGILDYETTGSTRSFPQASRAEPDKELFYEVFFTAFTICRELAEGCSRTVSRSGAGKDYSRN